MALEDKIEEKPVKAKQINVSKKLKQFKDEKFMYLYAAFVGPTCLTMLSPEIEPICENSSSPFVSFIERNVYHCSNLAVYAAVYSMATFGLSLAVIGAKRYFQTRKKEDKFLEHLRVSPDYQE